MSDNWIIRNDVTGQWLGADDKWYNDGEFFQIRVFSASSRNKWLQARPDSYCTAMTCDYACSRYNFYIHSDPLDI